MADAKCQFCGRFYVQRLRLMAHLRRYACGRVLVERPGDFRKLTDAEADQLDEADNCLHREAKRAGHSTPLARGAARRADGRVIGATRL